MQEHMQLRQSVAASQRYVGRVRLNMWSGSRNHVEYVVKTYIPVVVP